MRLVPVGERPPALRHAHIAAGHTIIPAVTARGLVPVEQRKNAKVVFSGLPIFEPDHVG